MFTRCSPQKPFNLLLLHDELLILAPFRIAHRNLVVLVVHRAGNQALQAGMNRPDAGPFDQRGDVVILDSSAGHDGDAVGSRHQLLQSFSALDGGLLAA